MTIADTLNMCKLIFALSQQNINTQGFMLDEFKFSDNLSTLQRKNLYSLDLCFLHMGRIFNTAAYLLDLPQNSCQQDLKSYDIEDLMNGIAREFERIVAPSFSLSVSFSSHLKGSKIITLDKFSFELTILNLLYCCIKTTPDRSNTPAKISITASETNDCFVFHIYDNNRALDSDTLSRLFADSFETVNRWESNSVSGLIALSLCVAQKSALDMNGRLTFKPLKSSDRYDIYLPKEVPTSQYTMSSTVRYTPSHYFFKELAADINLEHILKGVIESFEGEYDEGILL